MTSAVTEPATVTPAAAVWLDSRQVVEHSRLSLKTLLRANAAGEDCGLRKVGTKLIFHVPTLDAFLLARTAK